MQRVREQSDLEALVSLFAERRIVVLSGAGCSTESGIPDYRGDGTRRRATNPVEYRAFVGDPRARIKYWARSALGWPRFVGAQPNPAHRALAELELNGRVLGIITQNVDRLHQAAGSRRVIELHGALSEVRCLECGKFVERTAVQRRLLSLNPGWIEQSARLLPDGDAELPDEVLRGFRIATCTACDGALKPAVVFFGESVPRDVVDAAYRLLDEGDALLIVGSSLAVYSGYRFVRRALEREIPVALVNLGMCRADAVANVKIQARAGEILPDLARALLSCAAGALQTPRSTG
jgi:NAD-dependent SIR2 family protein deacetylase